MKKVLLLCFIVLQGLSFGQEVSGRIVDEEGGELPFTRILDENSKLIAYADSVGAFKLNLSYNIRLGFEVPGFPVVWVIKEQFLSQPVQKIVINTNSLEIEEVTISYIKNEKALDQSKVNVIDYLPIREQIISLKTYRGNYYIAIDSIGKYGTSFLLAHVNKPRGFYEDCLGNMHILGKDSAYQIAIGENNLYTYDGVSIPEFRGNVMPCIASFNQGYMYSKLEHINQSYSLVLYTSENEGEVVYNATDLENLSAVKEDFFISTGLLAYVTTNPNVTPGELRKYIRDTLGIVYPEVVLQMAKELGFTSSRIGETGDLWSMNDTSAVTARQSLALMRARPIKVNSFQVGNHAVVVDLLNDSVTVINESGVTVSKAAFDIENDVDEVWQDDHTGEIYLYAEANFGGYDILRLDIFSGKLEKATDMRAYGLAENFQIYDGWLYYIKRVNSYNKVFRTKIADPFALRYSSN